MVESSPQRNRFSQHGGACAVVSLAAIVLAGCGTTPRSTALNDSAFMPAAPAHPQPVPTAPLYASTIAPAPVERIVPATQPAVPQTSTETSAAPASLELAPSRPGVELPTPLPPLPAVDTKNPSYMTLGGVIAEVNGTPVYANTVLALLNAELAAKAREMDPDSFREFARTELQRQREATIADELEFAAAQLELSDDDKKLAMQIAVEDRQKLITRCGGSVEQARAKIAETGMSFDEFLQQQYRQIMQQVYYQKKIWPRIQVSAADMRKFYADAHDRLYSTPAIASYRVIKIDPERIGGPSADAIARQRITDIREKALHGADFTTLAATENQDDFLKSRSGDPGCPMQRDSYRVDAVDKAVWQLQPGQVTPVIQSDGAYWLAKLETRTEGRTRPFDDQSVQDDIHNRLWQQQFEALHNSMIQDMESESVVREDDKSLQAALDMAMQEYTRWHGVRQ